MINGLRIYSFLPIFLMIILIRSTYLRISVPRCDEKTKYGPIADARASKRYDGRWIPTWPKIGRPIVEQIPER